MSGNKFVRKNRNKFGGEIAFYIDDHLPSWTIKIENSPGIFFNSGRGFYRSFPMLFPKARAS